MNCEFYKQQLSHLLTGSLDESHRKDLENHLSGCPDCQAEFEVSKNLWKMMGEMPQPESSSRMRTGFHAMLENYKQEVEPVQKQPTNSWSWKELFNFHPAYRIAFALVLIVAAFAAGFLFRPSGGNITASDNRKMDSLVSQVKEMKQLMMLTMLENPSASERIRAVSYTDELSGINRKVTDALFTTLNEDANINVRLVTLEALEKLSKDPVVREGLVRSITQQDAPLVQSAIADLMVKLHEKRSISSLRELLQKKDLNEMVKLKIKQSIDKLM